MFEMFLTKNETLCQGVIFSCFVGKNSFSYSYFSQLRAFLAFIFIIHLLIFSLLCFSLPPRQNVGSTQQGKRFTFTISSLIYLFLVFFVG
jgi:hypothetical protein